MKCPECVKEGKPIIVDVTFSPEIAADFKAKKVRAFVPVSAAELIWLEASGEAFAETYGEDDTKGESDVS